jgi:hypothetical protein
MGLCPIVNKVDFSPRFIAFVLPKADEKADSKTAIRFSPKS